MRVNLVFNSKKKYFMINFDLVYSIIFYLKDN